MTETIIINGPLTIERTIAAGTRIVAASDVPTEGPWDAMLSLTIYPVANPAAKTGGTGVEIETTVATEGPHVVTVTPANLTGKMPFAGTLRIG